MLISVRRFAEADAAEVSAFITKTLRTTNSNAVLNIGQGTKVPPYYKLDGTFGYITGHLLET